MQKLVRVLFLASSLLIISCGEKKSGNNELDEKKAQLEVLKKQQAKLNDEVTQLEAVINKLDTSAAKTEKTKLVTTSVVAPETFSHYIDLQGKIESENISFVTPRGGGGQVKAVMIKRGDVVAKGQLLLKLDDVIARQSLIAAQQNLETLKTQLAFAKNIYQKQKNLWDQNIGTEVQLITAKNNVETVETQLKTAQEQVKIYAEQLQFTNITADVSGVADEVNIRVGELFMGAGQIKIVNTDNLKITAQIPENYLSSVSVGTPVKVTLPDINKSIEASVSVAGKLIDPNSRSFFIEAKIPHDPSFRPNQVAIVKIRDYNSTNAITIPLNTLQSDEKGKYVMVAVKEQNKLVARKRTVQMGVLYGDKLEIKSGLQAGEALVTDGFQNLYEGQAITTDTK